MLHLEGKIFGRLTVHYREGVPTGSTKVHWACQCICGTLVSVPTWKLTYGHTKSCGCLAQEVRGQSRITHGETRGPRKQWGPRTKMLYSAKARAKKSRLPFNITLEDIYIPETCPILGISLLKNSERCQPNSPSLDRVIPAKGYIRGNVQVISHRANTIKSDATIEELKKVVQYCECMQILAGREEGRPA